MRADRLQRLHAAVDRQTSEAVGVVPYTEGGYVAGVPDTTRPPKSISARVTEVPKTARAKGSGASTGHNAEVHTASHTVTYATDALPYALRRGDHVTLDARGGLALKVNAAEPYGTQRTILYAEILPAGTA